MQWDTRPLSEHYHIITTPFSSAKMSPKCPRAVSCCHGLNRISYPEYDPDLPNDNVLAIGKMYSKSPNIVKIELLLDLRETSN